MNSEIRKMLEGVRQGTVSVDDALLALKKEPFTDIGYAKVDLHRGIRGKHFCLLYRDARCRPGW